jgi:fumarate hydratase subunit alpha
MVPKGGRDGIKVISAAEITGAVKQMCRDANVNLPADTYGALLNARAGETSALGRDILDKLIENAQIARDEGIPVCQDTGCAVFFADVGQDVYIDGGLTEAINEGVRQGYKEGYLRKSVVADPLNRVNTGDNTPAIINYDVVPGDSLKITFAPKGFGSENMSALKMFSPSAGYEGARDFVIETVKKAGANPCPPVVAGVCVGGDFEKAALLAKRALTLEIGTYNAKPLYRKMQDEILTAVNESGIGPGGLGGKSTALWVNIIDHPTHIAGLPVAVNICCHVYRHLSAEF